MASHRSFTKLASLVAALAAASLSACAGGGSTASDLARWSLVEEMRVGSAADPAQQLTPVGSLTVDEDGNVYVAQPQGARVRVYNAQGEHLRDIGRRGSDPGQFDRVYAVGFVADSLYAIDLGLRRITYFSSDGEVLRTHDMEPPPSNPPFFPGMPFAVFPDGSMAIGTAFPATISSEDLRRVPQLLLAPTGEEIDTVAWIAYERTGRRADLGGRAISVGSPLSDDAFAIFSQDGSRIATVNRPAAARADGATFSLTLSDGSGDTVYSREYPYEAVPVAQQVVDDIVDAHAARIEGAFPDLPTARAFVRDNMFLPPHYPPVTSATFAGEEGLWIRREAIPGGRQRWMVLDERGEPVAETTLAEGVQVHLIRGDALWGSFTDDDGVSYVVRYAIERG